MDEPSSLIVGFTAYVLGTASPGPAIIAIMTMSAARGRRAGVAFALGVATASVFWGVLATLGFAALLAHFAWVLGFIKLAGGLYLLWLALRAFRSLMRAGPLPPPGHAGPGNHYLQGLILHLTNPKAVLVWSAVISLGVTRQAATLEIATFAAVCSFTGCLIFLAYAVLFSTRQMMALYARARRPVDALVGGFFTLAGIRLMSS